MREDDARSDMIVVENALPGRPGRFTRSTWCRGLGCFRFRVSGVGERIIKGLGDGRDGVLMTGVWTC